MKFTLFAIRTGPVLASLALAGACSGLPTESLDEPIPMQSTRLAISSFFSCMLRQTGEVICWGPSGVDLVAPADGPVRFVAIDGGVNHVCGLSTDSTADCWGGNHAAQLGDGTTIDREQPTRVVTDLRFVAISAMSYSTCALTAHGRSWCWGSNWTGQLGNGRLDPPDRPQATPAPMKTPLRFVSLGKGCALSPSGRAYCWGDGAAPGVGYIFPVHFEPGDCKDVWWAYYTGRGCLTPTPVRTDLRFFRSRVTADGTGYSWGDGYLGELGDGRIGDGTPVSVYAISPVRIAGGIHWAQIDGTCGLDFAGQAWCWGDNFGGQLGIGYRGGVSPVPVRVLTDVRFAELGRPYSTCALTATEEVWCWGGHHAPVGQSTVPVRVELPEH